MSYSYHRCSPPSWCAGRPSSSSTWWLASAQAASYPTLCLRWRSGWVSGVSRIYMADNYYKFHWDFPNMYSYWCHWCKATEAPLSTRWSTLCLTSSLENLSSDCYFVKQAGVLTRLPTTTAPHSKPGNLSHQPFLFPTSPSPVGHQRNVLTSCLSKPIKDLILCIFNRNTELEHSTI